MQVVKVPTNRPCIRHDAPAEVYAGLKDAAERREEIVKKALESGVPLLIGTDSTALSKEVFKVVQRCVRKAKSASTPTVRLLNSDPTNAAQVRLSPDFALPTRRQVNDC